VLTGNGPTHVDDALKQLVETRFASACLLRILGIEHDIDVDVSISGMSIANGAKTKSGFKFMHFLKNFR